MSTARPKGHRKDIKFLSNKKTDPGNCSDRKCLNACSRHVPERSLLILFSSSFGSNFSNNSSVAFSGSNGINGYSFFNYFYGCFFYGSFSFGSLFLVAASEERHAECYSKHEN